MYQSSTDLFAIKSAAPLSSVIGKYVDLRPWGREHVGLCPFHNENTPSFYVNDEKGVYHCFGCDASGDVIDFFMQRESIGFAEAVSRLQHETPGSMRRIVEDNPPGKNLEIARGIWEDSEEIFDTPAEAYLASRGLVGEWLPETTQLRFARLSFNGSRELHPALLAALRTAGGRFAGIQRTFLKEDGTKLHAKKSKMSLGNVKRNSIQLGGPSERITICEGLEDGLTLKRFCESVWVAAGAGMMKSMALPSICRHVLIAADNDEAGRNAAEAAARYYSFHGREVSIVRPSPEFKDFNEMHCRSVKEAIAGLCELTGGAQ